MLALAPGCGGDDCGTGGAPASGLLATGDSLTLGYGTLSAGLNNDCPASDAPSGVISLTIHGTQTAGTGFITLCVARPDLLAKQSQTLGLDVAGAEVRLIDVSGTATNCSFAIDPAVAAAGTATTSGLCGDGADPAGFALVVEGTLALIRTCGTETLSVPVALRGRIAVAADAVR